MPGRVLQILLLTCVAAAASPIQVTLTGVNGAAAFGYYVGPYYGSYSSQKIALYCDDFANDSYIGQTWQANLSTITPGSDLSQTRYGGSANALQLYEEIAWLDTQFAGQSTSAYGDIHATIWQIFDPAQAPKPSSNYWLEQAQQNYQSMDFTSFRVITNVGPVLATGQVQEFLTILPPALLPVPVKTPEPAAMGMIGAGLIGVGVLIQRVRSRKI